MNNKYGHLDNGTLVYAKNVVTVDGKTFINPSAATYLRCDPPEKLIVRSAPSEPAPEGKHWAPGFGYDETDTELRARWILVDDPKPTVADFDAAMEAHLTQERCGRGYTTREPDAYLSSSNPRWAQDAQDWVTHRDAVMEYALELINAVSSGQREPPTMEEFKDGLPTIVWTYEEGESSSSGEDDSSSSGEDVG